MSEQPQTASPDVAIQAQQHMRAQRLKKGGLILGVLFVAALIVVVMIVFSGADKQTDLRVDITPVFSSGEQEEAREAFKQALAQFESQTAPELAKITLQQWQAPRLETLEKDKERALALFANAGFMQALDVLKGVQSDSQTLIGDWHQAFSEKLAQATNFYANQQIQQARLALAQADKIKTKHPQSQTLRAQLSTYDKVQGFLQQLEVARVENNLEKQVALMQRVMEVDPTRGNIQKSLDIAIAELNQSRLGFALNKAQQALKAGNISEANTYLQQAEIIDASAKGIKALRSELNTRLADQSLASIKAELARLKSTDAWQQALSLAERGLQRFGRDAELQQTRGQASSILTAQRNIEGFIARPQRLADSNIRAGAQNALQDTILLLSQSPSLAARAQTLAGLIDQYSDTVAVTVLSDGQTHISVIGTGVVGKIQEKVINLSPGSYTFEGSRDGYRSKRLDVSVGIGSPITVSLVCDEKV